MRNRISLALAFVLTIGIVAIGAQQVRQQQTNYTVGMTAPLEPLGMLAEKAAEKTCGPYFNFSGVPKDPTKVGIVTFLFTSTDKAGAKNPTIPMFGTDKLQIVKVAGLKVPTVKMLKQGGPVYPWVEISISPEDLNQASCLKHSKVIDGRTAER